MANIINNTSEHFSENSSLTNAYTFHSDYPSSTEVKKVAAETKIKIESAVFLLNHVNEFSYFAEGGSEEQLTFLWGELIDCRDELAEASEIVNDFYKNSVEINH